MHKETYVSTGDHDGIGGFENLIVVFHAFLIFNLANNFNAFSSFTEYFTNSGNIACLAHKRCGDKIHLIFHSPLLQIIDILVRQRWQVHHDTGQIHVFAFSDAARVFNAACHFAHRYVNGKDNQDEGAISHQNLLAHSHTFGQRRVTTSNLGRVSLEIVV